MVVYVNILMMVLLLINIPFDEINRTIVGELKIGKKEECVICLKNN